MKIAFVVERNLYYKYYGPVIEKMLRSGFEVFLFHRRSEETLSLKNSKLFYYPFFSQIPAFDKKIDQIFSFSTTDDLVSLLGKNKIDVTFSLHSMGYYDILEKIFSKWFVLQHGVDSFKEKKFQADAFFVYSKAWLSFNDFKFPQSTKVYEVGQYYVEEEKNDRIRICQKYNLNSQKKFVLFSPLPDSSFQSYPFIRGNLRRYLSISEAKKQEIKLLSYLKNSLTDHGYEIIIKSRFKRFLPQEFRQYGHVFYDECFYPSSVNELISISEKVLINFMPGAIITEAAALRKDYMIIKQPEVWDDMLKHLVEYHEVFLPDGLDKKVFSIHDKDIIKESILKTTSFDNFSYREKFISPLSSVEGFLKAVHA